MATEPSEQAPPPAWARDLATKIVDDPNIEAILLDMLKRKGAITGAERTKLTGDLAVRMLANPEVVRGMLAALDKAAADRRGKSSEG